MLEYEAKWYGSLVVKADRFYPSTRRCSRCGVVKPEVTLGERLFRCDCCCFAMDRDLNAALNLERVAASWAETLSACERREVHALGQVLAHETGTETGQMGGYPR